LNALYLAIVNPRNLLYSIQNSRKETSNTSDRPNLREILWVQEEPQNMGAWTFVEPRLRELTGGESPVRYVGKPPRPSPAQGSAKFHKQEHVQIVHSAFKGEENFEKAEAAAQTTQSRAPKAS
jgi:2-oxoglutarate dehydrogenase E1 component